MQLGFCVTSQSPKVCFRLIGQESLKGLLTFCRREHTVAVLLGRLHYRQEVLASLRNPPGATAGDANLAAAVYEESGAEGIARLEGCFALAIWDVRQRRILARRDVLGGFPLYWAQREGRLAVGTSLDAVRSLVSAEALDPEYQAEYLMLPCCGQHEPTCERTPYRDVQRLLPTVLFQTHVPQNQVTLRQYWDWQDRLEDPGTDDLRVIAERYRELLRQAVRERMCGITTAHVSGGMDSTSVALFALAEIVSGAKAGPLHTISLTYDRMRVLARERPIIEAAVQGRPQLVPHFIAADDLLDFGHFVRAPEHEEPWPWLSMVEMEVARVDAAASLGAETVLTGQGADELLDMGPYHLSDLLRRGRFLHAWSDACQSAQAENCGVWPILHPFGIFPLLPGCLRDGWRAFLRGGQAGWMEMRNGTIPPWVRPAFARGFRLRDRALEHIRRTFHACRPTVLSVALSKILGRSGDLGRWYLSAPRGILVEHPFLDPRLLRFLLGVHTHLPPRPRSTPKPILTQAVKGILPDAIRLRPKAGFFNEPYYRGIARYASDLERLVRQADVGPLDWLDKDSLLDCLRQSVLGIGNDRIQLDRLNLTLSWLRWLSMPRKGGAKAPTSVHAFRWDAGTPGERIASMPDAVVELLEVS